MSFSIAIADYQETKSELAGALQPLWKRVLHLRAVKLAGLDSPSAAIMSNLLIHVHCGSCDWDGMGDLNDLCYRCGDDTLNEVHEDDERCGGCGQKKRFCECDEV